MRRESTRGYLRSMSIPFLAGCVAGAVRADVSTDQDAETGLRSWTWSHQGVSIELVQRLPDQTRAMFMQHAFSSAVIEELATSCMFQTIVRNTGKSGSGQPVAVDLGTWRVQHDGRTGPIKLKEPWMASWPEAAADQAARLVFRWGLFPTRQEFLPGDYNWGLTAYGLAPGSEFDLEVSWQQGGSPRSARITGIVCTPDVDALQ